MKQARKNRSAIPEPTRIDWGLAGESIGHLVRRVNLKSQAIYAEALEALDLTSFQIGILDLTARNEFLTQRRLADMILVDPSIVVSAVDALEERGLIRRRRSREDRRAFILEITEPGLELLADALKAWKRAETALAKGLSAEERRKLVKALRTVSGI